MSDNEGRHRGPRQRSSTAPSGRSRAAEPSRFAAFTLLRAVSEGAYANLELPKILRERRLDTRDAAFATELAFGTLRWQGLYDEIIAAAAQREVSRIDGPVLDVLRLGVHQLLQMRVAPHAAADQSVGLARAVAGVGAGGFVNAVMRTVAARSMGDWLDEVVPDVEGVQALSVLYSHPVWIVSALRAALIGHGLASAETVNEQLAALLDADNEPPRVHLVARPGLTTVDELTEIGDIAASAISPLGAVMGSGDPGRIPAIRDGRAAVQDAGSQLVAMALARVEVAPEAPQRWLDLCAGPGGKAGVLAGLALESAADFDAMEVSEHRADLVRATLAPMTELATRLGRTLVVSTADGREIGASKPGTYGRILVDAPCTGLGALRRRPEARWRRRLSDLATLGPLQRELLHAALDAVAPGGVVGYATCSPHLAETTLVVSDVLKKRTDVEVIDARDVVREVAGPELADLGDGPYVQLWPHLHGTDAMFLALLRRTDG